MPERRRRRSHRDSPRTAVVAVQQPDQAREEPLDKMEDPLDKMNSDQGGLVIRDPDLGPLHLVNSFLTDSGELRLLVIVSSDEDGKVGIQISNVTNRIEHMHAHLPAALGGLLRVGDRVLAADGVALGRVKLFEALDKSRRDHELIVQRAAPDMRAVAGLKALPEHVFEKGCYVAQLVRADLVAARRPGTSRLQLGLRVSKHNSVDYVVPGSVAAFEGTLKTCAEGRGWTSACQR